MSQTSYAVERGQYTGNPRHPRTAEDAREESLTWLTLLDTWKEDSARRYLEHLKIEHPNWILQLVKVTTQTEIIQRCLPKPN